MCSCRLCSESKGSNPRLWARDKGFVVFLERPPSQQCRSLLDLRLSFGCFDGAGFVTSRFHRLISIQFSCVFSESGCVSFSATAFSTILISYRSSLSPRTGRQMREGSMTYSFNVPIFLRAIYFRQSALQTASALYVYL